MAAAAAHALGQIRHAFSDQRFPGGVPAGDSHEFIKKLDAHGFLSYAEMHNTHMTRRESIRHTGGLDHETLWRDLKARADLDTIQDLSDKSLLRKLTRWPIASAIWLYVQQKHVDRIFTNRMLRIFDKLVWEYTDFDLSPKGVWRSKEDAIDALADPFRANYLLAYLLALDKVQDNEPGRQFKRIAPDDVLDAALARRGVEPVAQPQGGQGGAQLAADARRIRRLQGRLQTCMRDRGTAEQNRLHAVAATRGIATQLDTATNTIQQLNAQIAHANTSLVQKDGVIAQLRAELQTAQQEAQVRQRQLDNVTQRGGESLRLKLVAESEVARLTGVIRVHEQAHRDATGRQNDLQTQLTACHDERDKLNTQLRDCRSEVTAAETRLTELNVAKTKVEAEHAKYTNYVGLGVAAVRSAANGAAFTPLPAGNAFAGSQDMLNAIQEVQVLHKALGAAGQETIALGNKHAQELEAISQSNTDANQRADLARRLVVQKEATRLKQEEQERLRRENEQKTKDLAEAEALRLADVEKAKQVRDEAHRKAQEQLAQQRADAEAAASAAASAAAKEAQEKAAREQAETERTGREAKEREAKKASEKAADEARVAAAAKAQREAEQRAASAKAAQEKQAAELQKQQEDKRQRDVEDEKRREAEEEKLREDQRVKDEERHATEARERREEATQRQLQDQEAREAEEQKAREDEAFQLAEQEEERRLHEARADLDEQRRHAEIERDQPVRDEAEGLFDDDAKLGEAEEQVNRERAQGQKPPPHEQAEVSFSKRGPVKGTTGTLTPEQDAAAAKATKANRKARKARAKAAQKAKNARKEADEAGEAHEEAQDATAESKAADEQARLAAATARKEHAEAARAREERIRAEQGAKEAEEKANQARAKEAKEKKERDEAIKRAQEATAAAAEAQLEEEQATAKKNKEQEEATAAAEAAAAAAAEAAAAAVEAGRTPHASLARGSSSSSATQETPPASLGQTDQQRADAFLGGDIEADDSD